VGFEPTRAKPTRSPVLNEIKFSARDIEEYINAIAKTNVRPVTIKEYRQILNLFFNVTTGTLNSNTLSNYIERISKLSHATKYSNITINFLERLSKKKGIDITYYTSILKQVKPPKKQRKLYADEGEEAFTLSLEDIHEAIRHVIFSERTTKVKLKVVSLITLLASTGIRPQEACELRIHGVSNPALRKSMIDLSKDYFILPSGISKTHAERVIPLHPDTKLALKEYFVFIESDKVLWNYEAVRKIINETDIKKLSRLRKFFTKKSKELNFDQIKRIAIQGHDERELIRLKVTETYYEKYTPSEIVREYMEKWGKVKILPDDVLNLLKK